MTGMPGTSAVIPPADGRAPSGTPRLPAVIAHLTAICGTMQARGVTVDVQAPAPGR